MFEGATAHHFALAKEMRRNATPAELLVWKHVSGKTMQGLKFRRQHPIGGFILDFYCHALKLAIEADGQIHDDATQAEYDKERTQLLHEMEIELVRFSNEQVLKNISSVLNELEVIIKERKLSFK